MGWMSLFVSLLSNSRLCLSESFLEFLPMDLASLSSALIPRVRGRVVLPVLWVRWMPLLCFSPDGALPVRGFGGTLRDLVSAGLGILPRSFGRRCFTNLALRDVWMFLECSSVCLGRRLGRSWCWPLLGVSPWTYAVPTLGLSNSGVRFFFLILMFCPTCPLTTFRECGGLALRYLGYEFIFTSANPQALLLLLSLEITAVPDL